MANEQFAFIHGSTVPDRETLQESIELCGFDLSLDEAYEPDKHSGFLPCTLHGHASGVEVYFERSVEGLREFSDVAGDRDAYISFRWGGDMAECAVAMIVSYALAKHHGAKISYEGAAPYGDTESLLNDTNAVLKDALSELSDEPDPTPGGPSAPDGEPSGPQSKAWWQFWK